MTERLRGALAEIAERAPIAQVPDDTYRRGRRSHRGRVAAGAVAVVLVLLGLGSAVRTVGHDEPPVTHQPGAGAVPSQLYGVPERLTMTDPEGRWTGPVETDLAIGAGSAAWQTGYPGPPVVVTARDGAYHLLDLPGFAGADPSWASLGPALALSPDGRSLAYAWSQGRLGTSSRPVGLRVVDLSSGEVRDLPLPSEAEGTLVLDVAWSPDGRWLSWDGGAVVSAYGLHGSLRGVLDMSTGTSRRLPTPNNAATSMGVDNNGRAVLITSARTLLVSPSGHVTRRPGAQSKSNSMRGEPVRSEISPDGGLIGLADTGLARSVTTLEIATGRRLVHQLPRAVYPDGAMIVPLGWVDDSRLLALLDPEGPAPDGVKQRDLVVLTPTRNQTSTFRIVGHADGTIPVSLSVAVDLMAPDHYTEDLPAPDWPWSAERKLVVASSVVLAAGLLVWLAFGFVRRRRVR